METAAQLDALRAMGCQRVQGFLTGAPMAAQGARRLLAAPPAPVEAARLAPWNRS